MLLRVAICAAAVLAALPAVAQDDPVTAPAREFPAVLAGHALLPARSFLSPPPDAPKDLRISGKFTTGARVETPGTVEGRSAGRPTGVSLPFRGQAVQGHSGIKRMPDGSFWLLTDNGFGTKSNSADAMLFLNRYRVDFEKGRFQRLETVYLHDPDKKVPFRIVHEDTKQRYLTGADFDTESFQFAAGALWIGDEFGPWLIKADLKGRVLAVFETRVEGQAVRSPDHPAITAPATPDGSIDVQLRRSKGFEGMALSKDGRKLYALLEGPLWNKQTRSYESIDGREALRVLEFDLDTERWSGRSWMYPLEAAGHAIGDFNMIDDTTGLIIERDNGEGTADKACPPAQRRTDCFHEPARFKRVYKVELNESNAGGAVRKIGYIDLMKIADPQKRARKPLSQGALAFPFFTIENVDVVDAAHLVVGNDNNLPFSSSREPQQADDNELVLLEAADFLKAR